MVLAIALVVVLVLFAVALLPVRRRDGELKQTALPLSLSPPEPVHSQSLRQQQLQEEATAVAAEYQRRADAVWLAELRGKAAALLTPDNRAANE